MQRQDQNSKEDAVVDHARSVEIIKEVLKFQNITQVQLSTELGLSKKVITQVLNVEKAIQNSRFFNPAKKEKLNHYILSNPELKKHLSDNTIYQDFLKNIDYSPAHKNFLKQICQIQNKKGVRG